MATEVAEKVVVGCKVGDFLPPSLTNRVVSAIWKFSVIGDRGRVVDVLPDVGPVDRSRHRVILAAGDEQERGPGAVGVVDAPIAARSIARPRSNPGK
jgi:hypothetical protein